MATTAEAHIPGAIDKAALRRQMLHLRRSIPPAARAAWSQAIVDAILGHPFFARARGVASYAPLSTEVDVDALNAAALAGGKRLFLPRVSDGRYGFGRHEAGAPLLTAPGGVQEPPVSAPAPGPGEIDLVLVPALAFDGRGQRLGFGSGWYDRALERLGPTPVRLGVAFSAQLVEALPDAPWDQAMDLLVTEAGFADPCGGPARRLPPDP